MKIWWDWGLKLNFDLVQINDVKGLNWRIDKFGNLIELGISLINEIKGFNWRNIKIQGWFGVKLQEIKVQWLVCKRRHNAGV